MDRGGAEVTESSELQLELARRPSVKAVRRRLITDRPRILRRTGTAPRAPDALDLNYVIGDEVRLFMKDGEVERMEVVQSYW